MLIDTWRLYPILALALLAGGSVWLERITRIDDPVTRAEQTGPDFIAHDTRVVGFGAMGRKRYELVAERLEHFPAGDITRLHSLACNMHGEEGDDHDHRAQADVSPAASRSTSPARSACAVRAGGGPAARPRLRDTHRVARRAPREHRLAGADDPRQWHARRHRACAPTTCSARSNSSARSARRCRPAAKDPPHESKSCIATAAALPWSPPSPRSPRRPTATSRSTSRPTA
jgi:lipopolysaccharide export system protein LptC